MIRGITKAEYDELAVSAYWRYRWLYIREAIRLVDGLQLNTALEFGTGGIRLFHGSCTMDIARELKPDVVWDGCVTPWPFASKSFDIVVGLQVWEHLIGKQAEAFREMKRVAHRILLSVPYKWPKGGNEGHEDIDEHTIDMWTELTPYKWRKIVTTPTRVRRILTYWDFTQP